MTFIMPTLREFPYNPKEIKESVHNCHKSWYMTLLYVNNFQDFKNVCIGWSWYLMVDMQFYVLAPLLVLPFLYSKVIGKIVIGSVSMISILTTAFIYSYNDLHASLGKGMDFEYFTLFYNKPYCRIIPYLMGILFFNLYTESKQGNMQRFNNFISKGGKYLLYGIGLVLMYFSITVIHYLDTNPNSWSQAIDTLHELTFRPAFIFGLICIIYPTISGYGKLLGNIFGYPLFNPFSKLTYSMYMVHLIVVYVIMLHGVSGHYSTLFGMWVNFFINTSISLVISFLIFVIFENPLSELNRMLIPKQKPKQEEAKPLINESVIKP
jgi:peptidoglycan/LPS O-acetylase OafA/YrhL